ncbi:TPA: hypothetical protein DCX16_01415 [bacterium]|nr:hypothetical protein [bacterium]
MKKFLFLFLIPSLVFAGFKEWGAEKAIDLATRFDEVLFDLEIDSSDLSGLPKDKRFKLSFNLLPFTIPPIFPNISIKGRVFKEKKRMPQVAFSLNYGEILGLRLAEKIDDVERARCYTYGAGLILKKTLKSDISLFSGVKKIGGKSEVFLKEKGTGTGWFSLEDIPINVRLNEYAFFTGLYILRGKNGFWSVTSGIIPGKKKLFSKIELGFRKHWVFGLGIYPEGTFVFHPTLGLRW